MRAWKAVVIAVGSLLAFSGCISENAPDVGSITIYNDSDEAIVVLTGAPPRLGVAEAVGEGKGISSRRPGSRYRRQFQQIDNVDWCEAPLKVYWITRTDLDISPHGTHGPFDPDDFEILETIGPNICWGERNAEYHYTGD